MGTAFPRACRRLLEPGPRTPRRPKQGPHRRPLCQRPIPGKHLYEKGLSPPAGSPDAPTSTTYCRGVVYPLQGSPANVVEVAIDVAVLKSKRSSKLRPMTFSMFESNGVIFNLNQGGIYPVPCTRRQFQPKPYPASCVPGPLR